MQACYAMFIAIAMTSPVFAQQVAGGADGPPPAPVPAVASPVPEETPSAGITSAQPNRPRWAWPIRASFLKYPKAAAANRVTGKVELRCTVSDAKGHVKCIVVSETPEGYDFGSEAVKGIEENMRAARGVPVGTVMTTPPMKFTFPG